MFTAQQLALTSGLLDALIPFRAISRDPQVYHSADDFIPERFQDNPDVLDPRSYVFGHGRR